MTVGKILNRFEVEGYQESDTVIVCGTKFGTANNAAEACLKSHGSDPEGVTFQFNVQALDPVGDPRWLIVAGDYTLDGSTSKFENCRAIDSNAGVNASLLPIDFGGDSGLDGATIRIYGGVTHENFPLVESGISVGLENDQAILSNTLTKVNFDSVNRDIDSEYTGGTFTAKHALDYRCAGVILMQVAADNQQIRCEIHVNAVSVSTIYHETSGTKNNSIQFDKVLTLDVGDTVEIHVINEDAADTIEGTVSETYWQMTEENRSGTTLIVSSSGSGGTQRTATNGAHPVWTQFTTVSGADMTLPGTGTIQNESIRVEYKGLMQTDFTVSSRVVTLGFTPDTSSGNEVVISYVET